MWQDLPIGDVRRLVAWICNQTSSATFPSYDVFVDLVKTKDLNLFHECQHVHTMYIGKWAGWWELSWDVFEHECDLYPINLVVASMKDSEYVSFAPLLAELQLFKSSSEAKKNGWNKPIEKGDFFFKKKTYILRIVD